MGEQVPLASEQPKQGRTVAKAFWGTKWKGAHRGRIEALTELLLLLGRIPGLAPTTMTVQAQFPVRSASTPSCLGLGWTLALQLPPPAPRTPLLGLSSANG